MPDNVHEYAARLVWDGNIGDGTASYTKYGRQYRVIIRGKSDLEGSADPHYRGDAAKHNPEELLLASISACHMLSYLALCARKGISVLSYEDRAEARMVTNAAGGGKFEEATLHPAVTIRAGDDEELAMKLHHTAHELCFIANSCNFPIRNEPVIQPG